MKMTVVVFSRTRELAKAYRSPLIAFRYVIPFRNLTGVFFRHPPLQFVLGSDLLQRAG